MKKTIGYVMAGCVLMIVGVGGYLAGQQPSKKGTETAAKENTADTEAIKKAGQSFIKAYMAGDAKGMAAHWTENGEYFTDDGETIRGRGKIEKAYLESFGKKKEKPEASIEVTSIRFPSKDSAIEEGYFKVRVGKEAPITSKYTVLHVREGDKWLMAVVRKWPSEGATIRDLEWLIGSWQAKRDDTEVHTTYEWWGEKTFIRVNINITTKDRVIKGFQMIGKDASTGQIRSWAFDPEGSFGEGTWIRDGKKWVQDSAAVLDNGSTVAATHILTRIDNDNFTFQSVQRSVDGEEAADIAPIRVTRVKGK